MKKLLAILLISIGITAHATDLVLWHAFDGVLGEIFTEIVEDFNHHSGTYKIIPVKKKNLKEVFEGGIDAYSQGNAPHILQVYEVATLTAMMMPDTFLPVDDLMNKFHKKFDPAVYIDVVRSFYSNPDGKMMSFPWNASTGILYYNKNAFSSAGLDPNKPPVTWDDLENYAMALLKKGYIGFTTAWPAAYHLEHLSCWHNLPFATENNGFGGLSTRFNFNDAKRVFHISKVSDWQKRGLFQYAGRFTEEPEKLFTDGKCAILLQGANRLPILKQKANFPIGVGFMPYWPELAEHPYNLNIGGSSFWVFSGFNEKEYRGIVQFFEYLSSTEVQAFWHQKTGYLPITDAAYYLTKKKGFYKDHPAAEIAVLEVMQRTPTPYSQGMRFGDYVTIRDLFVDFLEKAFTGQTGAKDALDQAVKEGNILLEKFEKENSKKPSS